MQAPSHCCRGLLKSWDESLTRLARNWTGSHAVPMWNDFKEFSFLPRIACDSLNQFDPQERLKSVGTNSSKSSLDWNSNHVSAEYTWQNVLNFYSLTLNRFKPLFIFCTWLLRLVLQMEQLLTKMQALYDSLTTQLSEATVHPEALSKPFDCTWGIIYTMVCIHYIRNSYIRPTKYGWIIIYIDGGKQSSQNGGCRNCLVRTMRDEIQNNFVQATKFDVAMNSLLVRGKNLGTLYEMKTCHYIPSVEWNLFAYPRFWIKSETSLYMERSTSQLEEHEVFFGWFHSPGSQASC